ncbi:MAG: GDSL-type esterase/lipase family protein, partial [Acidobacteriota bacterium]|nr:GDSL-type esterase/lipase family protein [Acidobacteriota bacterium]
MHSRILSLIVSGAIMASACVAPAPTEAPAAGAASAPVAVAPAEGTEAREARPEVVFLGDSLTAGLGLDPAATFPALIQERLDEAGLAFAVVNAGVSGDTSAGGLRRLEWALGGRPRVLVV